ncbi:hypothetical protein LOTGIDRAFT_162692 [Lottia gigantea]|uniref:Lysosomal dipeptide transporter MFSD1 n=1 Tax=Lottia gigantea TaxID=225164 RepID=V4A6Q5_LOTGI|nr:hypothetical protein LOTGIDRAFT_162692 [Lottia gigantea]ESO92382.1 hypothetical protein LOTGIDRAFT_162692 [Lottia gigantea]
MPSYSEFRTFRFLILFCGCMLTFGSFFSFDMPSTIQTELQELPVDCDENGSFLDVDNATSEFNVTCCTGCLGLGPLHYNLLFALYAWTASINVLIAGVLVDKLGTKFGAVLYGSLSLSGSLIFALSIVKGLRNTEYMFPMLMIGRFLLGSGNSGMRIVQDRVTAFWFRHKELSLAFGICLTFSRLGSVFNFLVTSVVVKKFGLEVLFWASSVLCCSGFLFVVLMSFLDQYGLKKLNKADKEVRRTLECKDIRDFSATYWILTIVTMLSYSTIIPYIADSSKLYQDKYGYNQHIASYIAGAPYYIALLGAPILGILVITMWPSVPLLVKPRALGIAMGILTSFQFIGIGIANLVMGKLLNLRGP